MCGKASTKIRMISVTISSTVGWVEDDEPAATEGRFLGRDLFEGVLGNNAPDCGRLNNSNSIFSMVKVIKTKSAFFFFEKYSY